MAAPPLSLPGIYGSLRTPTLRDLIYSTKAFAASLLALVVGFSQNLENPYWSVLTVYIIVNPPGAGAIRSKALFRLFGTAVGGVAVVALTGLFGDQIGILVAATIALIIGATYLQHIDKTPTNYFWFAIGITASVIELNNVTRPTSIFDVATARVAEISLGIIATLVVETFWPEPMTPKFLKTMAGWRGQARDWLVDAIGPNATGPLDEERRQGIRKRLQDLIKGIGAIDAIAVQLPLDVVDNAPRGRHLDLVRRQVAMSIAHLVAIELRAQGLRADGTLRADLGGQLDAVVAWVKDGPDLPDANADAHVARGEALAERLDEAHDAIDPAGERIALIERGLLARLAAFVRDWSDLALALRGVMSGRRLPPRLERVAGRAKPVRSTDYVAAALDLMPMAIALSVAALIWYLTAWDSGPSALLFAFAGCVFLLGQGQILQSISGMLLCVLIAFAFVFLYQFVILPRVTDFPVLAMVLGCALVPIGVLMAMSMAGMLISALTFSFLGLQNVYVGDFAQSLQTLAASLVGLLIAVISLRVCAYDHARFTSRRLATAVRRDILDLARARRAPDGDRFLFLALYRLSLYFAAAEQAAAGKPLPRLGLVRDLSIGGALLTLRNREAEVSAGALEVIDTVRDTTIAMFRAELAGRPDDHALRRVARAAIDDPAIRADPAHDALLDALVGLDLALKDVPPPAAEEESE